MLNANAILCNVRKRKPQDITPVSYTHLICKEGKNMKKIMYQVCTKLAACAFLAAIVSVGTASCNGVYQPKMPDKLVK